MGPRVAGSIHHHLCFGCLCSPLALFWNFLLQPRARRPRQQRRPVRRRTSSGPTRRSRAARRTRRRSTKLRRSSCSRYPALPRGCGLLGCSGGMSKGWVGVGSVCGVAWSSACGSNCWVRGDRRRPVTLIPRLGYGNLQLRAASPETPDEKKWTTCGMGPISVNTNTGKGTARLLMRQLGNLAVVLNVPIFSSFKVGGSGSGWLHVALRARKQISLSYSTLLLHASSRSFIHNTHTHTHTNTRAHTHPSPIPPALP